jgi:bifunctional UDP-N-acetylglucosamine pyrophosphorylase/glucosamine-1-phosphate N-acetyltransferase/UDP-N-acetylglucosamine pyrophosphorylase
MDYKDVGIVILAAGKGTRMKSDMAKVLHKVAGKSMIAHVIECARKIARDNIHVVVGYQAEQVKTEINQWFKVDFALQPRLLGTGDAVKSALPGLMPTIKDVLVLCGDVPLIQEKTLKNLIEGHKKNQAKLTVLATDVEDPSGYGRIILDRHNNLLCIKEEADASAAEKKINRVNTGIYCFDKTLLMSIIDDIKPDNQQAEYYLTDGVEIAQKKSEPILVLTMDDPREVIGVNTLEQLAKAEHFIQQMGK